MHGRSFNTLSFFLLTLFALSFFSCKDKKSTRLQRSFELLFDNNLSKFRVAEELKISLRFIKDSHPEMTSYKLFVNNKLISEGPFESSFTFQTKDWSVGKKVVQVKGIFEDNRSFTATKELVLLSDIRPKRLKYTVLNTYYHDIEAYTQGLEFSKKGELYESTGEYGGSSIRKVDYKSGKVERINTLPNQYFGEGMTILHDQIYQLTWQELTCFVYDKNNLEKTNTLSYSLQTEGWGLCSNNDELIMSDGSANIYFLDPKNLREKRRIQVYNYSDPVVRLNELEMIKGKIYANIYTQDLVVVIDPNTGKVEAEIDLANLLKKEDLHENIDVLNGIALHPESKTIFVTGKNWPKLFELQVDQSML